MSDQEIYSVTVKPSQGWSSLNWRELWNCRELLFFLTWRDIKVRYKQTVFGITWAVLQPFLTMVVFTIFFGKLAKMPSDGIPYPIFAYSALLPWQLFSHAVSDAANSLVANQQLITKVYFPRLIIPVASILGGLVDFLFAFFILVMMMVYYGFFPTWRMLLLPLLVLLTAFISLGAGFWLASLNVKYRDVRYAIPFLIQIWFFATPITYPTSLIQNSSWRYVYSLNPMVGVAEGFRWVLLAETAGLGSLLMASLMSAVLLVVGGLIYFRNTERTFADII